MLFLRAATRRAPSHVCHPSRSGGSALSSRREEPPLTDPPLRHPDRSRRFGGAVEGPALPCGLSSLAQRGICSFFLCHPERSERSERSRRACPELAEGTPFPTTS